MKQRKNELSTTQVISLGFFLAILVGTILLSLPVCSASGKATPLMDALFTATTSVCVTGLVVVPTYAHWSLLGKIIILILIQLGGLGVVSFSTAVMMFIGRRITLKDRMLLEDALNLNTLSGLVRFLRWILKGTFLIEGLGFAGYCLVFVPQFGPKGIWYSLFNAVSAFCNAGMDIIGPNSLENYITHPWINIVTMFLIIMGGLGFIVWMDLLELVRTRIRRHVSYHTLFQRLRLHTKLVLITTLGLILGGALAIFILEYDNPGTIGNLSLPGKLLASLFQSVTTRTAGFQTFSQKALRPGTMMICIFLMFIGGSSIGTAGGVKTTTIAVLILSTWATIKGNGRVVVFHKHIRGRIIKKALAVIMVSMLVLFSLTVLLYQVEKGSMSDIAYETTSAIATVGLTRNLTPSLHTAGKAIIILMMYLGRIGPISMAIIFGSHGSRSLAEYPEEEITVG